MKSTVVAVSAQTPTGRTASNIAASPDDHGCDNPGRIMIEETDAVVIMEGSSLDLERLGRRLERSGIASIVLPPPEGKGSS
jgi:hypothetical protein